MGVVLAETIYDGAKTHGCQLTQIRFDNVAKTKKSALIAETVELYKAKSLDELIRNAHLAANHMTEVGLVDSCIPVIEKDLNSRNGFIARFVVREPKAITVGVKMGVTQTGAADGSLTASKQSLFGSAEEVDVSLSKSLKEGHNFSVSLTKPWLGWQLYKKSVIDLHRSSNSLAWNCTNVTENAFSLQHASLSGGGLISQLLKANFVWRLLMPTSKSEFQVREHAGHTTKASLEYTLSYEKRDRPILPTTGLFARWTTEITPFLGDSSFIRSSLLLQAATKLPFGFFFNSSLQTQAMQNIGSRTVHLLDRIYLGGPLDVRGFKLNSIGPRIGDCALGGAFSLALTAHLLYPLYPKNVFFAHAFTTAGSVVSVQSRNWFSNATDTMRCSAGIGIAAIVRDLIRFELNYAVPISHIPGDQCEPGIYFGAGMSFL